jgi:hypothetical protein
MPPHAVAPVPADRARRREGALPFVLVLIAVGAFTVSLLFGHRDTARRQVRQEDGALAALGALREAERAHHGATGRYVDVDELARAGRLPPGGTLAGGSEDPHIALPGYRIDVLLPVRLEAGRLVRIARPVRRAPDATLATRHMTLVARPIRPPEDGYRTYTTDETGATWVAEGVSDDITTQRNPLPDAHLSTSELADGSGRVWHRLERLVPFGDAD